MGLASVIDQVEPLLRRVAGDVLLPQFQNDEAISDRRFERIVAALSRDAEARISTELTALLPGSRAIGEELAKRAPNLRRELPFGSVWLVDPLDGTQNFVAGLAPFTMMVALLRHGEPIASWILAPLRGELAFAERGSGAFFLGERLRTGAGSVGFGDLRGRIMTQTLPDKLRRKLLRRASYLAEVSGGVGSIGSEYISLAQRGGHFNLYGRASPWEHAAGALLLREAGGHVARPNGELYRVWDEQTGLIAAATPELWRETQRALLTNAAETAARSRRRDWVIAS